MFTVGTGREGQFVCFESDSPAAACTATVHARMHVHVTVMLLALQDDGHGSVQPLRILLKVPVLPDLALYASCNKQCHTVPFCWSLTVSNICVHLHDSHVT